VDATQHVTEGDGSRRAGEEIAALLSAHAAHDLLRLQFDEDLNEVIRRHALFAGNLFDSIGDARVKLPRERQHGTHRVITFDGELHAPKRNEPQLCSKGIFKYRHKPHPGPGRA
jgi:hypothetical protein